jgi:hypothetical protein
VHHVTAGERPSHGADRRVLLALLLVAAMACAVTAGELTGLDWSADEQRAPVVSGSTAADHAGPNFEQPFVDDLKLESVAQAAGSLAFDPAAPASLGDPSAVFVHRTYRPQALGLVYEDTPYGRMLVIQEPVSTTQLDQQEQLEGLAARCSPATRCEGRWAIRSLASGARALVIANAPVVTGVIWIRRGVRFQIMGPSLNVEQGLAVANAFDASLE